MRHNVLSLLLCHYMSTLPFYRLVLLYYLPFRLLPLKNVSVVFPSREMVACKRFSLAEVSEVDGACWGLDDEVLCFRSAGHWCWRGVSNWGLHKLDRLCRKRHLQKLHVSGIWTHKHRSLLSWWQPLLCSIVEPLIFTSASTLSPRAWPPFSVSFELKMV